MVATYEETMAELDRRKKSGKRESPGVGRAFLRGIKMTLRPDVAKDSGLRTKPGFEPPPSAVDQSTYEALRERGFGRDEQQIDIPAPQTSMERIAQGIGEDAPAIAMMAPFAPMLGAGAGIAPAKAALMEMGLGAFGSGVSNTVEEMGGGPLSQMGAEFVATAAAPIAAPTRIARRIGRATIESADDAMRAAARGIAEKHGLALDDETILRGVSELKRKIAKGVKDPDKYIDQSRENLARDIEDFGEVTPTLAQSLSREGGQNLSSLELNYAKMDQDYASEALGRRLDVEEELLEEFDAARPQGSSGGAMDAYRRELADREDEVERLWSSIDGNAMQPVDTSRLKEAARESVRRAGEFEQDIPEEALKVLDWPDEVPWEQFQQMRSRMLRSDRLARKSIGETAAGHKADNLSPTLKAFNDELEVIGASDPSGKYLEALAARRKLAEDFDPKSAAIDAFTQRTEPKKIVMQIKGAKDPQGEARRIVGILSNQEGGVEGLQTMFIDELFGRNLGDKSARSMRNALSDKRDAYVEVFGEKGVQFLERVIRKQGIARTGKAGTSAQAAAAGSGQAHIANLSALADDARTPLWSIAKGIASKAANTVTAQAEIAALIRLASQDIRLAKALLDIPAPRAEPAWKVVVDMGLARAKKEAETTLRRNAIRRAGDESEG